MNQNVQAGYERGEPNTWAIVAWGGASIVILVVVILAIQFYFDRVTEQQVYQKQMLPVSDDLLALRAKEQAQLHSYAYIDRAKGVVRIPIERAMELLAQEAEAGKLPYSTKPAPVTPPQPQGGSNAPVPAAAAR